MNLKSKTKDWTKMRFAYLVVPAYATPSNDEELYEAIRTEGRAVIREFGRDLSLGPIIELSPEAFKAEWQGD